MPLTHLCMIVSLGRILALTARLTNANYYAVLITI